MCCLRILFHNEEMPPRGYRSRVRKGGAASRYMASTLAFSESFADQKMYYSSEWSLIRGESISKH